MNNEVDDPAAVVEWLDEQVLGGDIPAPIVAMVDQTAADLRATGFEGYGIDFDDPNAQRMALLLTKAFFHATFENEAFHQRECHTPNCIAAVVETQQDMTELFLALAQMLVHEHREQEVTP